MNRLRAEDLTLAYDGDPVTQAVSVELPVGQITAIVGANASGKSTLLRGLARLLVPREGVVLLDGEPVHRLPTREVARRIGLLPQGTIAPPGITVAELVARGRAPHQSWWRQWTEADERAVVSALVDLDLQELATSAVDQLSGGQRQRVWIATALAQETPVLLLDEPTTYLDLAHQVEVLELLRRLNEDGSRTIAMVLHDLNQAARYADHLVALRDGRVVAEGPPGVVVTEQLVRDVFDLDCRLLTDPVAGTPIVVPVGHHKSTTQPETT